MAVHAGMNSLSVKSSLDFVLQCGEEIRKRGGCALYRRQIVITVFTVAATLGTLTALSAFGRILFTSLTLRFIRGLLLFALLGTLLHALLMDALALRLFLLDLRCDLRILLDQRFLAAEADPLCFRIHFQNFAADDIADLQLVFHLLNAVK